MSEAEGRKATIIYGPSLADPGGDETPLNTAEDKKMAFDDLKIAMAKFRKIDEKIYTAQLKALNDPKNRRQALAERIPGLTNQTEEMKEARENVLNGLEMIDLLEQIDIIDTMIGHLGTLERQIQDQISIFIQKGCTIETLIGTPMKPHGKYIWKVPPDDPYESAEIFLQECRIIRNLKNIMMRVIKLSDEAETEGTIWGNKLKKFNKEIDFRDPLAEQVFIDISESLEEVHSKQLDEVRQRESLKNKIQKLEQSILLTQETLDDLYQQQKKLSSKRGRRSEVDKQKRANMVSDIKKLEAMQETSQNNRLSLQKKLKLFNRSK